VGSASTGLRLHRLYVGQAKRLARISPEQRSAWGRSMLAERGGLAVQRSYRLEGRRPTANATQCRVARQGAVKAARQPDFQRAWISNMDGI
jgi:hypothetical protein